MLIIYNSQAEPEKKCAFGFMSAIASHFPIRPPLVIEDQPPIFCSRNNINIIIVCMQTDNKSMSCGFQTPSDLYYKW